MLRILPRLRPTNSSKNILKTLSHSSLPSLNHSKARNFSSHRKFDIPPMIARYDLNDVGGNHSVIKSLLEIVRYFESPMDYSASGINPPKGVIISGEPGTGKTMLAEAIAGHAGVPLLMISGSAMIGEYIGEGERLLRELFEKACAIAPCIICIDEIESLGSKRFSPAKTGGEQHNNTGVNQLLTLLAQSNKGVVVIATTNNYQSLDEALVRPGRFDKHIVTSMPDAKEREQILKIHTKNKKLDPELSFKDLAFLSGGYSGARLAAWVNEAAILAFREEVPISEKHFNDALNELEYGALKPDSEVSPEKNRSTAIHEAGHALVGHLLGRTVYQVSIQQYGASVGHTNFLPDEEKNGYSKDYIMNTLCRVLGGKAAEDFMRCQQIGCSDDILKAKEIAEGLTRNEGWGETLSGLNYQIDAEIFMQEQLIRAVNLIKQNSEKFNLIVNALLQHKQLNKEQFLHVLQGKEITVKTSFANNKSLLMQIPPSKKIDIGKFNIDSISNLTGIPPRKIPLVLAEGDKLKIKFNYTNEGDDDKISSFRDSLDARDIRSVLDKRNLTIHDLAKFYKFMMKEYQVAVATKKTP